jgi:hypothetical protein
LLASLQRQAAPVPEIPELGPLVVTDQLVYVTGKPVDVASIDQFT